MKRIKAFLMAFIMLSCMVCAIGAGTLQTDAVTISNQEYEVYFTGRHSSFLCNKQTAGNAVGTEYFLTYTVESATSSGSQNGFLGTSAPETQFPYTEGNGLLYYQQRKSDSETPELLMEGYTYFFTYEETLPHRRRDYWQMPCALGGDLSQGDDFCSFVFLFPLPGGHFGVKTRNYITELTLNKLPSAMRFKYDEFAKEGSLVVMPGTVLDVMQVYDDLDDHIVRCNYDPRCFGFDPYNAREFVERWEQENGPFGIEKVIQGAKTESVPLGELKKLAEERMLHFDEDLMTFCMGNCIALVDTNGNRKLLKKRHDAKIDSVAAMMDAYIAWKHNKDAFE